MLKFVFDECRWVAETTLESWRGFQARQGPYGGLSSSSPSNGAVKIVFAPDGRPTIDVEAPLDTPLTEAELALVERFLDREPEISAAVLRSLYDAYPGLQAEYGYEGEERRAFMPDLKDPGGLKHLIGLHMVHVQPLEKDGMPYVGYEIGCTWDDEHGVGILMHGERTVSIGGADEAFMLSIAERDAKRRE